MTATHPEDTPIKRFGAFLWGVAGYATFAVLLLAIGGLVLLAARSSRDETYASQVVAERAAKLEAVMTQQRALLEGEVPIEKAMSLTLQELKASKPHVSAVPVPGSPAFNEMMQKQMEQQAPPAPAGGDAAPPEGAPSGQ
jgi:hypothetical protein